MQSDDARDALSVPATAAPSPTARWQVHKFGGTSVMDAARITHVADILQREHRPLCVVVSAMRGTTDALIGLCATAAAGHDWHPAFEALQARHRTAARDLPGAQALEADFDTDFRTLAGQLDAIARLGIQAQEIEARIAGLGEVWSARLLQAHLRARGADAAWLDARTVVTVTQSDLGPRVDWRESARRLADWQAAHPQALVVATGFIARTHDGRATTLGRNGSDFSGAIFAALLDAEALDIWTDVDGILSADPRLVPEAVSLPRMSYAEACELAYFGARVLHPQTLEPAMSRGLPIRIRNTFRPEAVGTRITRDAGERAGPVAGLSLAEHLALLELSGSGLIGVPGTAERLFGALRAAGVSVVMISQGSSEHSICCVVRAPDAERAEAAVRAAFAPELAAGQVQGVSRTPQISVLAAVGDGMSGTPGVSAQLFGALGRARVNVRAIAQGASERNISVAVDARDAARALRAAHAAFWLSPQTVSVGLVGPGKVGQTLLAQIAAGAERLRRDAGIDLRVTGIASSRLQCLSERGLDPLRWREDLAAGQPTDLDAFAAHVHAPHLPHAVIIDCSASGAVADRYAGWLAAGIHVVTANKQAGGGDGARLARIRAAARDSGAKFRYEATVGAGLPIISTLRDLLDTGDRLIQADGMFSGTLAWLFNRFDGSRPFSALVAEAQALGYTEPDPRDDLSGLDVARKTVILAREAGLALELSDVAVESLVPAPCMDGDVAAFFARLPGFDAAIEARRAAAAAQGQVLRYLARVDARGGAQVGLQSLPASHPFANTRLTDNIVQFQTERYRDNPLIVQGPGAGPEVTAAGVFADLLRVATGLGARR